MLSNFINRDKSYNITQKDLLGLSYLIMQNLKIKNLPSELFNYNIKYFNFDKNSIKYFPDYNFISLSIQNNQLVSFKNSFSSKEIKLNNNKLRKVEISKSKNISLRNNCLESVKIGSCETIDLRGNKELKVLEILDCSNLKRIYFDSEKIDLIIKPIKLETVICPTVIYSDNSNIEFLKLNNIKFSHKLGSVL